MAMQRASDSGPAAEPAAPSAGGAEGRARRGRPGGAESRARILEAAGRLFARNGYDAVTVRALARAADVNVAAIAYYFGGKEGLYHEVLRQIVADTEPLVAPVTACLGDGVRVADNDPEALSVLLAWFVRHLLHGILGPERRRWQMALMMREFYEPSPEFPLVLAERIDPLHDAVAGLVAAALGTRPKTDRARLLAHAVIGQCMCFGAARPIVFARLGWNGYTAERVEQVIGAVTPALQAMLGLPAVPAPAEERR